MSLVCKEFKMGDASFDLFVFVDNCNTTWFKTKEIVNFLRYKDDDDDADQKIRHQLGLSSNWDPHAIFVNVSGLNHILQQSKSSPKLEAFQHWLKTYQKNNNNNNNNTK